MGKALEGVRILDMTHITSRDQACTQILAYFGADVIKVEKPGEGDPTRMQLRDIPGQDGLYFTMLNSGKRAITLNLPQIQGRRRDRPGKLVEEKCDVMVENFAPGTRSTRMGFLWEKIPSAQPAHDLRLDQGLHGDGPFEGRCRGL